MAAIPRRKRPASTVDAIWRDYEGKRGNTPRTHLGASVIGGKCKRANYYRFRWALPHTGEPRFAGRILRLFETGELAEPRLVKNLRDVGVRLVTTADAFRRATKRDCYSRTGDGPQDQISFRDLGGHVGGSMDAFILGGLREAPVAEHVLEIKTASGSRWNALAKKGVEEAKPEHYTQMQLYMHWSGVKRAVYLAVNKDTDNLHFERIELDMVHVRETLDGVVDMMNDTKLPPRLSNNKNGYQCRFCDYVEICHGHAAPLRSCRTCIHATPHLDASKLNENDANESRIMLENHVRTGALPMGLWTCRLRDFDRPLPVDRQVEGCGWHLFIPTLITGTNRVGGGGILSLVGPIQDERLGVVGLEYANTAGQRVANIVTPLRPIKTTNGIAELDRALIEGVPDPVRPFRRARDGNFGAEALALAMLGMADPTLTPAQALQASVGTPGAADAETAALYLADKITARDRRSES